MKKFLLFIFLIITVGCKGEANLISSVMVQPQKITIIPSPEFKEQFGVPDFFVEYKDTELDLTQLPYSIVTLPFVVHAFPMILRSGQTYYVDKLDVDFNTSMPVLQQVFEAFYSHLPWSGKLVGRELVKYSFEQSPDYAKNKYGIVSPFSGGIDSMYNSLASLDKKQQLITLHGGDVPLHLDVMWRTVKQGCQNYCAMWGCYYSSVISNFAAMYGHNKNNPRSLWTMATQGLSYSGLVAPLAIAKGYPFILIGSAVTAELPVPYGSHPFLDHAIRYAGVNVIHFGGECTRADKIRFIINITRQYNRPNPQLRVCWRKEPMGKNCCECINKCLPTIHGLLAEGVDPREYGFEDWSVERMIELMKDFFQKKQIMSADRASVWNSIKDRIKEQLDVGMHFASPLDTYFAWLSEQDFMNRVQKEKMMSDEVKAKLKVLFNRSMSRAYKRFNDYFLKTI